MSYPPGPPTDGDPTPENPSPGPAEQGAPGGQPGGQPGYGPPPYGSPAYGPPGQPGPGEPGYGQAYPPQYGYGPGPAPGTNGKATASLITGISALLLSWCCGLGLVGVVAIVLGVKARNQIRAGGGAQSGDGMALGGIITGSIAMMIGVIGLVFLIVAIATGNADYNVDGYTGGNL